MLEHRNENENDPHGLDHWYGTPLDNAWKKSTLISITVGIIIGIALGNIIAYVL